MMPWLHQLVRMFDCHSDIQAEQFTKDHAQYDKTAAEYTRRYAQ